MKRQKYFPLKQPFNLYLDRYEDPKEVNKRYLQSRLAKTHPFEGPEPPPLYPASGYVPREMPSWQRTEVKKERINLGRISDTNE